MRSRGKAHDKSRSRSAPILFSVDHSFRSIKRKSLNLRHDKNFDIDAGANNRFRVSVKAFDDWKSFQSICNDIKEACIDAFDGGPAVVGYFTVDCLSRGEALDVSLLKTVIEQRVYLRLFKVQMPSGNPAYWDVA